ncbi:hypothetical protein RI367_007124 [Sorochytrium milnesiophthora]
MTTDRDTTIHKVLVANRGEIARRIVRTCRRLGKRSVAIFTDADRDAPHVAEADEAVQLRVGATSPPDAYLDLGALKAAITASQADAVHPGYGFLSENADFARLCQSLATAQGRQVVWIGPDPESIEAVGDKISAKRLLSKHAPHVPLVPGYSGDDQSIDELERQALRIGFPVLLKASAGGGGKGMRVVRSKERLRDDIELARSEGKRSFGSDRLLLERYFERVKHIEVQIIGDRHGNVYHIFERECSMQRRHQKVIEETPAFTLNPRLRDRMLSAAVDLGKMIGYVGVGTVEFLLDDKEQHFYFLEVNTRLQVEHPITECITGLDLVELQLRVAQGESLAPLRLEAIQAKGHAIEVRLCAENPLQDFAPCTGKVLKWTLYHAPGVRYDSGIEAGGQITMFYDSMISKVIVWAPTRTVAIALLQQTLLHTVLLGVTTNKAFMHELVSSNAFQSGTYTTRYIEDHLRAQSGANAAAGEQQQQQAVIAAAMWLWSVRQQQRTVWRHIASGYRNVPHRAQRDTFRDAASGKTCRVEYTLKPENRLAIRVSWEAGERNAEAVTVQLLACMIDNATDQRTYTGTLRTMQDSKVRTFSVASINEPQAADDVANVVHVHLNDTPTSFSLHRLHRLHSTSSQATNSDNLYTASMPCRILSVAVASGAQVKRNDLLYTVESMKMETKIYARQDGQVELFVRAGDLVEAGKKMAQIK